MSLPVDELLQDLRDMLELFESDPCDEAFEKVQKACWCIEECCEDLLE